MNSPPPRSDGATPDSVSSAVRIAYNQKLSVLIRADARRLGINLVAVTESVVTESGNTLSDSLAPNCGKRIGIFIVTYNAVTTLAKVWKRIPASVLKNV